MQNYPIALRRATLPYLDDLRRFAIQTFTDTYAAINTSENMSAYIESAFDPEKLDAALRNPDCQHWIAFHGDEMAGYCKLNFRESQTAIQDETSLEIERIYVLKKFQGRGIGKSLIEKVYAIAAQQNLDYIWLSVWQKNENAIRFYESQGYWKTGEHEFVLGNDVQLDFIMRKDI